MTEAQPMDRLVESLEVMDTRVPLREYIEALLREVEARQLVRHQETDKAVRIAETATRESLEKHNGLLGMMRDRDSEYARKVELNSMNKRIDELSTRVYWLLGVAAAAGTVSGAVASKVL